MYCVYSVQPLLATAQQANAKLTQSADGMAEQSFHSHHIETSRSCSVHVHLHCGRCLAMIGEARASGRAATGEGEVCCLASKRMSKQLGRSVLQCAHMGFSKVLTRARCSGCAWKAARIQVNGASSRPRANSSSTLAYRMCSKHTLKFLYARDVKVRSGLYLRCFQGLSF